MSEHLTDEFIDRHLHIFGESSPEWMHVLMQARRERDDARAECERLRGQVAALRDALAGAVSASEECVKEHSECHCNCGTYCDFGLAARREVLAATAPEGK